MLRSLHISHYVLIDSLDTEFPEGLVIITGQTGAGKSILLGALSLLTGAKADASVISSGADSCVVEAEFDTRDDSLREMLCAQDIEWEDGHLLLRRVVHSSGRSRSFVNDSPVSLGFLSQLSSSLVDIHSQNRNQSLLKPSTQLALLDDYAGNGALRGEISAIWKQLRDARSELDETSNTLSELSAQKEYNDSQLAELRKAAFRSGEQDELEAAQSALSNGEEIADALSSSLSLLDPPEGESVCGTLKTAERILEKASAHLPSLRDLSQRLLSCRVELEDIIDTLGKTEENFDFSPEALAKVEERLSLLYSLERKHSVGSIEELDKVREDFEKKLYDTSALQEKVCEIEKHLAELSLRYDSLSTELHAKREAAAPALAAEIESSLRFLELDRASFGVSLRSAAQGQFGTDEAVFTFSSSSSVSQQELSKCASGGELSRIMLSLKALMARYEGMPTMIFDEIDTGVSGSAADKMGRMICEMGRYMQVFAITHLPQVAAKGNAHYVVEKTETAGGDVSSSIHKVEGEQRVREIARLLSGESITAEALANARTLLTQ